MITRKDKEKSQFTKSIYKQSELFNQFDRSNNDLMILKQLLKKTAYNIYLRVNRKSQMKAFSHVPPRLQQRHEVIFQEIPLQKVIEVEGIRQPKRPTKQISNHVISNPNQIYNERTALSQKNISMAVEKSTQKNVSQNEIVSDRIVQRIQITEKVVEEKQKTEFSLFACKQVELEQGEQLIFPDKSPIKFLYQIQQQEKILLLQSAQLNQTNHKQFSELTHIVFTSPAENVSNLMHIRKPIFFKDSSKDLPATHKSPQQNLAESIVNQHQINQQIAQNLDSFVNPNQFHNDSHIECTLFGNSDTKPHQSSLHRTGYEPYNSQKNISPIQGQIRRPHNIFDKAEGQTTDKELYESYHRNKNKPKQLGGSKKLLATENSNKISLKTLKMQLTKLVTISPRTF